MNPLLGTIFDAVAGGLLQGAAMDRNVQANKQLMAYQSKLAQRQQEQMLSKQMPLQIGSMVMAGLNPSTVNGVSSPVGMSAPSASVSTPSSPYVGNIANSILASKQAQKADADIDLVKSQANYYDALSRKTGNEADVLDYDLLTYFQRFEADLQKTIYESNRSAAGTALDFAKADEVRQNIANLQKAVEKMQSEIVVNNTVASLNNKQIKWYDAQMQANIDNALANANYMTGEDKRRTKELYSKVFLMNSSASMMRSQSNFIDANKELIQWNTKLSKRYGDAQNIVGMTTGLMNSGANLIQSIKPTGLVTGPAVPRSVSIGRGSQVTFDSGNFFPNFE